jgi:HTH-type transcriptional regulator / antitoxin HigA
LLAGIGDLTWEPVDAYAPRIVYLYSTARVALFFVPELSETRAWGVTYWLSPYKAVVQLSLIGKTDDHLWFTFFHGAAHILLHPKRNIFAEVDGAADNTMTLSTRS